MPPIAGPQSLIESHGEKVAELFPRHAPTIFASDPPTASIEINPGADPIPPL
jgi:hypothetical protein